MVIPTVQRFDPTKPAASMPGSPSRFHSQDMRSNFQALSRANDLRCTQQNPPDLTVFVEAGAYAISSQQTQHFPGGSSPILDTTAGGTSGWQKIFVLELGSTNTLIWNTNGTWVPANPVAPSYTDQRIPLCEVSVTYGETYISQVNIVDVRPMINLGVGLAQLVNPGEVVITATGAENNTFDTSAHFHFFPGQHEILVWSDPPNPLGPCGLATECNALLYRISGVDYVENSDHSIHFRGSADLPPGPFMFTGGERIVIWKIGMSATPGKFSFNDLSDVSVANAADFGDRGAALVPRLPGDVPSGINPYQTYVSHNLINHLTDVPSLGPVVTHLTTVATNAAHRHHALEIEVSQSPTPLLYDPSATDVQIALASLSTNLYSPFRAQHFANGTHGGAVGVTILQTSTNAALTVEKYNATQAVDIFNYGDSTALAVTKFSTDNSPAILITNSGTGTGAGVRVYQQGDAAGVRVEKSNTGSVPAIEVFSSNAGAGIAVLQNGTGPGSHGITVTQNTGGSSLLINHSVVGQNAVAITRNASGNGCALTVTQQHTSSAQSALRVSNYGTGGMSISAEILNAACSNPVIQIVNNGSGWDIQGNNSSWWFDRIGNSSQVGSSTIGNNLTVHEDAIMNSLQGFFVLSRGPQLNSTAISGYPNRTEITVTHSYHPVNNAVAGSGLARINGGTYVGQILIIQPVVNTLALRGDIAPSNFPGVNINLGIGQDIMLIFNGSVWNTVSA